MLIYKLIMLLKLQLIPFLPTANISHVYKYDKLNFSMFWRGKGLYNMEQLEGERLKVKGKIIIPQNTKNKFIVLIPNNIWPSNYSKLFKNSTHTMGWKLTSNETNILIWLLTDRTKQNKVLFSSKPSNYVCILICIKVYDVHTS